MPETYIRAWKLRRYCPHILIGKEFNEDLESLSWYDEVEKCEIETAITKTNDTEALKLVGLYHSYDVRKRYNYIILIKPLEIFSCEEIEILQRVVLNYLHRKEIVIETLPSSNVRISHYKNMNEYHLWNWLQWQQKGYPIPPIVVGTDDPGIFATNIYNEYANIYCYLTTNFNKSHNDAIKVIRQLNENGRIYAFK